MVSSFPKMQKSSASFSQSIRNRLRLKKLQAQAKNFCRVLDIRVSQVVDANPLDPSLLRTCFHCLLQSTLADNEDTLVRFNFVDHTDVFLDFIHEELRHGNGTVALLSLAKQYRIPFAYLYLPDAPQKTKRLEKVDYDVKEGFILRITS